MSVLFKDKITGIWKRAAANLIYASFPVGSIVAYGGSSDAAAPAGCMYCHGQVLNESEYPDLYAVIGTKFGVGDGSAGSFSLPELRGEFLRGAGPNQHSGQGSGDVVGAHQNATEIPNIYGQNSTTCLHLDSNNSNYPVNKDSSSAALCVKSIGAYNSQWSYSDPLRYTSRPTNTSVEYIIKVVK